MPFRYNSGNRRAIPRGLLVASVAVLSVGACHDEPRAPRPVTLENAWPNQDGRSWTYEATLSQWSTQPLPPELIFAHPDSVPAAPSLLESAALLEVEFTGPPISSENALYTLRFAGRTTTESGATGQHLVETVDTPAPAKAGMAAASFTDRLLGRLAEMRPDLRARIQARSGQARAARAAIGPLFLHGGAWEKTDEWIGTYGHLNAELAWLYLDADVDIGHEFELQLVPELADDVFLHGRVHRNVTVENGAGTYENALEVIYQLDTGVSQALNPQGEPLGYIRLFDVGRIAYAAGVGPVDCEERLFYAVGKDTVAGPFTSIELPLQNTRRPER